jgi:hypothetical protein
VPGFNVTPALWRSRLIELDPDPASMKPMGKAPEECAPMQGRAGPEEGSGGQMISETYSPKLVAIWNW